MSTKKFYPFALAILLTLAVLAFPCPVYASDVSEAETVIDPETEALTDFDTSAEVILEIETGTETAETVKIDKWIYDVMKQATPEQVELIEGIVLGGLNALDELDIEGFDRVRVWVEYNMATVMVIALLVGLILFFVGSILQKKGFAKKADLLNSNAIEMYEAGQQSAAEARAACKQYADRADANIREYASRADAICRECADAAKAAAESAQAAQGQVTAERTMLIAELEKNAKINAALTEEINFLLQCSDLSQAKREEAEAILRRGLEEVNHDETDEA